MEHESKYWEARPCAKFSPVPGSADQLHAGAVAFMREKLKVEEDDVADHDIVRVRRVRGAGPSLPDECLVTFREIAIRDLVCSHAKNLGEQNLKEGEQRANIRLEIPAHLRETFRTLDTHGHILKTKYGRAFRRHIRYDDENRSRVLEVRTKPGERWERISPDTARFERRVREERERKKMTKGKKARTVSTIGSSEESESESGGNDDGEEESDFTDDQSL